MKSKKKNGIVLIAFRLEEKRAEKLDKKAKEMGGISRTDLIKIALNEYGI